MLPSESIDHLIAAHPDWRSETLAQARRAILDVDPGIVEQWKYMGAPAWELDGPLIVGNIFKAKVKLGFMYGASLEDRRGLFNGELKGKQRRSYELAEGDLVDETVSKTWSAPPSPATDPRDGTAVRAETPRPGTLRIGIAPRTRSPERYECAIFTL